MELSYTSSMPLLNIFSKIFLGSCKYKMLWLSEFCAVQDGNLKVFEWPSMVIILDKAGAHKSVKDLDFRLMAWTNITIKLQDPWKGKKGILYILPPLFVIKLY